MFLSVSAQDTKLPPPMIAVDSLYREDQFYIGFTYNTVVNRPEGFAQNKFSSGYSGGFLRDMPINKSRTVAIAAGLGAAYNKTFQNLLMTETNDGIAYTTITAQTYSKNKIDQVFVEIPFEFRWRNSTPQSHKFWRVYTGFKVSYLVYDKYVHVEDELHSVIEGNDDYNKFVLGTYLSCGYNTWNAYVYYGLTPMFKSDVKLYTQDMNLNALNFGLMFYIL